MLNMFTLAFNIQPAKAEPRTWTVDDDLQERPNADFKKIQDAVDAAGSGDFVDVYPGTYIENIDVNKNNLTIKSESGAKVTIVQAANPKEHVFEVTANYVNIIGFMVKQVYSPSDYASGIVLNGVENCKISENKIDFSSHGIALVTSKNNILTNNTIKNAGTGISLRDSSNYNIVKNNTLEVNNYGIFLYSFSYSIGSDKNTITRNKIMNNYYYGINLRQSNNNVIYLNDFINNADNTHSEYSTNIWNSTEKITYTYNGKTYTNYLGNYWSDYTESDANNDGIGDAPYSIDSDKDNYPLVKPWENYFPPKYSIIKSFSAPSGTQPNGLAWDGENLWMSSYMLNGGIYKLNPTDGSVLNKYTPQ